MWNCFFHIFILHPLFILSYFALTHLLKHWNLVTFLSFRRYSFECVSCHQCKCMKTGKHCETCIICTNYKVASVFSYLWGMYSSWNMFLWVLWQCRWHSCRFVSVKTLAHTHKHTCRTVQPSGWIASMGDITAHLKDGMQGGESIKTGWTRWGTPASGLKLHNDTVSAYRYYKMLQKLCTMIKNKDPW